MLLLTESQTSALLYGYGVRESIRTLVLLGHLVRIVNRNGVHYAERDIIAIIPGLTARGFARRTTRYLAAA